MKILNIHDYPPKEGGGVEVNTYEVSKVLAALGNDVTIATSRLSSETVSNKEQTDLSDKVRTIHLKKVSQLKELIELSDVVHIHFTFSFRPASMLGLKLCAELNKPCVFSFRTVYGHVAFSAVYTDSHLEQDRKFGELKQYLASPNVHLSGPSKSVNETLKRLGINKKVTVIRNGCTALVPKVSSFLDVKKANLTYIGELSFLKGINYLIDAMAIVVKSKPRCLLRLIGGGSDELAMRRLVSYYNLEDNVEFVGYVPNNCIPSYLAKTDVYVHPSLTESWGNSVVEALSMGVPVICSKISGLIDATANGKFATLVNAGDVQDLAKSIREILKAECLEKEKIKAVKAMKHIKKKYTFNNQAKQLDKLYKSVYSAVGQIS